MDSTGLMGVRVLDSPAFILDVVQIWPLLSLYMMF